jgi:hypothetical protein
MTNARRRTSSGRKSRMPRAGSLRGIWNQPRPSGRYPDEDALAGWQHLLARSARRDRHAAQAHSEDSSEILMWSRITVYAGVC